MESGAGQSMESSVITFSMAARWSMPATPIFTSSMSAPASTCARASFFTETKLPAWISSRIFFRPVGLMRSPIMTGAYPGPAKTVRVREVKAVKGATVRFGASAGSASMARRMARMCAGVVPQQPPVKETPASAKREMYAAMSSGPRGKWVSFPSRTGMPAFGWMMIG